MRVHPLPSLSLDQAKCLQFKAVDAVTRHFDGLEVLSLGDLGVVEGLNKPVRTVKVEKVFADLFGAEAALLVRGAGTGALRWALHVALPPGETLLVHDAPVYPTTRTSLEGMGARLIVADFNSEDEIRRVAAEEGGRIRAVLIQHTRQRMEDGYDFPGVVRLLKSLLPAPLISDDNYAALKVPEIGCQAGADLSTFSCFKILGPEGVGVVLGKAEYVERAAKLQYSGGCQVQGHEAMAALRGLIYAPVALAVQAQVGEELLRRLNGGEVPGVKRAFLANAQSKVLLVEFEDDIAGEVLAVTPRHGAAAHPVGSESRYEFAPMIYRISGTFRQTDAGLEKRMIRVNPMRSGPDTVVRILRDSLAEVMTGRGVCRRIA